MRRKQVIAVLFTLGLLFIIGAVGGIEQETMGFIKFILSVASGFSLIGISIIIARGK